MVCRFTFITQVGTTALQLQCQAINKETALGVDYLVYNGLYNVVRVRSIQRQRLFPATAAVQSAVDIITLLVLYVRSCNEPACSV